MSRVISLSARVSLLVLAALLTLPLAAWPVTAQAPSAAPAAPAGAGIPGPLPESYPWIRLAEALTPAVVNVRTIGEARSRLEESLPEPLRPERPPRQMQGLGSGFVIDASGYIVTNHHVVDGAKTVEVTLNDGRKLPAKVVGSDSETDIALIKVEAAGLPTIPLGNSSALKVAEPVMAIGNPFGLDHTVTVGIISGTSRVIGAGRYDDFLQTDAAINPGNSGGPLINTRGEAIGIASAIASRSGGFQGVGFAIPIDLAKPIVQQLRTAGHVTRGWLGVSIQPLTPELARSFGLSDSKGVLVASVMDGSPAERAGLKPGDVILKYDGRALDSPRMLPPLVANTRIGKPVELSVVRDGGTRPITVTVGNMADAREARGTPSSSPAEKRTASRLGLELSESERGVVVTDVRPNSPAAEAGIAEGDVIREVNRTPVRGLGDVEKGMARRMAGGVLLRVDRQGSQRYVVIEG